MTNKERRVEGIKKTRGEKAQRVQELWALDTPENDLTEEQKAEVLELTKEIEGLKKDQAEAEADVALEKQVNDAAAGVKSSEEAVKPDASVTYEPPRMQTLGEQFVDSASYKSFFGPGGSVPSGDWKMDGVELNTKATMLSGGTVSGAGPYTQYVPGVIDIPAQSPMVADLLPSAAATAPQIQFFRERIATNNAAGVAEAAGKPESVIDFQADSNVLTKIATYLPVSDEMLEDAPAIQNYINQRLAMFVRTEEDQQILSGAGSGSNEVEGFIGNYSLNGVGTATVSGASGTALFGTLLSVMNNQRGSSQLDPTGIIMHPRQFGSIVSFYDTNGQFYGGGPLTPGAYGGGRSVDSGALTAGWGLWNVPIHVTTAIGGGGAAPGTMLLGNFSQGAQLWRKGGISVSASNSHSDFFKKNLTAIRAEERLALTVYRPQAFTVIRW